MTAEPILTDMFAAFVEETEPSLKQVFCAAYGRDVGLEATAEALAYAWEHWERIGVMDKPARYLFRVGQSRVRSHWAWRSRQRASFPDVTTSRLPEVEPGLPKAVSRLSEKQRVAVVMVCAYGWTHHEVGELLGVKVTTVQNHLERGLVKLRRDLGVKR